MSLGCPVCQEALALLREVPAHEALDYARGSTFAGPVSSLVWECPTHGPFRIFANGAIEALSQSAAGSSRPVD